MPSTIGNEIIKLQTIESTNNYATAKMYAENWQEGTIVQAEYQTWGRGQVGNRWESEAGKNLLCSILLKPSFLPIQNQFLLSKVVSLALWQTLSGELNDVTIKWPNDLYAGNRKIAGILIENAVMGTKIESSIVGIGLNINQEIFLSGAPNPISLAIKKKQYYDVDAVRNQLVDFMNEWYARLFNGQTKYIDNQYAEKLYRRNEFKPYRDQDGEFTGMIKGVNAIGQLQIVDRSGKIRQYHFKEVEFIYEQP